MHSLLRVEKNALQWPFELKGLQPISEKNVL